MVGSSFCRVQALLLPRSRTAVNGSTGSRTASVFRTFSGSKTCLNMRHMFWFLLAGAGPSFSRLCINHVSKLNRHLIGQFFICCTCIKKTRVVLNQTGWYHMNRCNGQEQDFLQSFAEECRIFSCISQVSNTGPIMYSWSLLCTRLRIGNTHELIEPWLLYF